MLLDRERKLWILTLLLVCVIACDDNEHQDPKPMLQLASVRVGTYNLSLDDPDKNTAAPVDEPIVATFNAPLDIATLPTTIRLMSPNGEVPLRFSYLDNNTVFSAEPENQLEPNKQYSLVISDQLKGENGETFSGHTVVFTTTPGNLDITSFSIAGTDALTDSRITNIPLEGTDVEIIFSDALDPSTVNAQNIRIAENGIGLGTTITLTEDDKKIVISVSDKLKDLTRYQVIISEGLKGKNSETIQQLLQFFYTAADPTPDFPIISDNELLTLVQQQTFKYFWEFGHPVSGLARERNSSGDVVTSGGQGLASCPSSLE